MPIQVGCARGCGSTIEISDEQVQEFIDLKEPIIVSHEVCPGEDTGSEVLRHFHVKITLTERRYGHEDDPEDWEDEELASMGGKVDAKNFSEALPGLAKELDGQWQQIQANAQVIDPS